MWKKIFFSLAVVILVIIILVVGLGDRMFTKQVSKEIETLFADSEDISDTVFTYDQLSELPEPVQRYFKYSLQDGQHYISYARLKHNGTFRTNEDQKWMPISGEEYFTTQRPGFVWYATVKPFPSVWIAARDMYFNGHGNMLIKIFSTFTIADAKGSEMDYSSLIRFLSEAPWYPTALLPSEYLQWEEIDSESARAVISDGDITASAIFYFDGKGEITRLECVRYMSVDDSYSKETLIGYYRQYKEIDKVRIPHEVEVVWHLKTGDFSYARFRVTEIEFNNPSGY